MLVVIGGNRSRGRKTVPEIQQNASFSLCVEEVGEILVMALLETCPTPCHI